MPALPRTSVTIGKLPEQFREPPSPLANCQSTSANLRRHWQTARALPQNLRRHWQTARALPRTSVAIGKLPEHLLTNLRRHWQTARALPRTSVASVAQFSRLPCCSFANFTSKNTIYSIISRFLLLYRRSVFFVAVRPSRRRFVQNTRRCSAYSHRNLFHRFRAAMFRSHECLDFATCYGRGNFKLYDTLRQEHAGMTERRNGKPSVFVASSIKRVWVVSVLKKKKL